MRQKSSMITPIAVVYLISAIIFTGWSIQRPYVPLFAREDVGASLLEVGIIASASGITGAILAVPFGLAGDRLGRKLLITIGLLVLGIPSLLLASAMNPIHIMLAYAVAGLGIAILDPSMAAVVGDLVMSDRLGRAFGIYTAVMQSAFAAGPAIGGFLIQLLGYRYTFVVVGGLILSAPLLAATFLPGARRRTTQPQNFAVGFRELRRKGRVRLGWTLTIIASIMIGGTIAFIPLYLKDIGFGSVLIGLLFMLQSVASGVSRLPFGALMDRAGSDRSIVVLALAGASSATATLAFLEDTLPLAALMVLMGAGLGVVGMAASVMVAKATSESSRGVAMGFSSMFRSTGFAVGPALVALITSAAGDTPVGYQYGFAGLAAVGLLGIALALKMHSST